MNEAEFLKQITQSINELLLGDYSARLKSFPNDLTDSPYEAELKKLYQSVNSLIEKFRDADIFILNLSKGNLDTEVPKSNLLISPFKELQANLRHLVWQTHRIAEGDYSQRIDFLGDFSSSYNYLISSLREKQALEKELSESEEKYRMLAQNVSDVLWKFDTSSWRLTYISPSVYKLRGFTVEEAMEQSIEESYTAESRKFIEVALPLRIQSFQAGNESGRVTAVELQQTCKNGSVIWVETVINFITDADNKVVEILGVSRNVDKRKEAEEELKKYASELKELNTTKDKFFSIIAHDLRNPFNALINLTDSIIENIQSNDNQKAISLAGYLKESSQNAFDLLQNLLEWSVIQRGGVTFSPSYLTLLPIVEEEINTLENISLQKQIKMDYSIQENLLVRADRNMLKTILRNLISNALKYTEEGGRVTITASKNDTHTMILVKDTGTGMNEAELEQLFKINSGISKPGTRREKGTGLGLILCKEFVSLHSGKIWAESTPGIGSKFYLSLPL